MPKTCTKCGIDLGSLGMQVLKEGRLIAGVIPRCPGHRPLNHFVCRRPTVRELLEQLTRVRKRDEP